MTNFRESTVPPILLYHFSEGNPNTSFENFIFCVGWFGIRLRYGEFLLQKSALIQEFVNISYTKDDLLPPQQRDEGKHKSNTGKGSLSILGAIESLELPD